MGSNRVTGASPQRRGQMSKRMKKRVRAQAVAIPAIPELDEHADVILELGRRSFADVVEIGRRLVRCRKLLKAQRIWLAWIKMRFGWSCQCEKCLIFWRRRSE
jgi:hypothetical protein